MGMPVSKCSEILKVDERIAEDRLEFLEYWGILEMFDRLLSLLSLLGDLMREVEAHTATLSFPPQQSVTRSRKAGWNDRLRLHMFGSSMAQFLFAFSHLCRAQTPEIYGHMRRAMEAAGVAYLSRSQPDIGKIYGKGDESKLWKRIKRDKIFSAGNPLTSELNEMMKQASSRFHSNLRSVVGSIEEDFEYQGSGVLISFYFNINDGGRSP